MVVILSFGYLHSPPPADTDLVIDLRRLLADPAAARHAGILDMDGRDQRVQDIVCATPGACTVIQHLAGFAGAVPDRECVLAVGCAGGRHRSVAVAILTARQLTDAGVPVQVRHRHVHLPRVLT
jgi:UPF0042 nucleotide-binding protein